MTPSAPEKELPNQTSAEYDEVHDVASVWERQGYSPLITSDETMAIGTTFGPMMVGFEDDGDDWSDEDDISAPSEALGDIKQAIDGSGANIGNGNGVQEDLDFRSLADQALSQLEQDYFETVRSAQKEQRPKEAESQCGEKEIKLFDDDDAGFADWGSVDFEYSNDTKGDQERPASATKSPVEIDSDAVRKAVSKLQIQQPSGFSAKYKEWGEKSDLANENEKARFLLPPDTSDGLWTATMIVPHHHPLIDATTLATYARKSSKLNNADLEEETHRLSRAATLVDAIYRLDLLQRQDKLVVHLIGCDHEEQDKRRHAESTVLPSFLKPVIDWLAKARQVPPALEFHLIGPNLQVDTCRDVVVTGPELPSSLRSVTIRHHSNLYHDYLKSDAKACCSTRVDIIVSYHAGIWGYDSWKPTLEYLSSTSQSRTKKIPFVITAYTLWECQEDYEVLETFQSNFSLAWKPQISPFGSHKLRLTATAPSTQKESYRENAAWQAWKV